MPHTWGRTGRNQAAAEHGGLSNEAARRKASHACNRIAMVGAVGPTLPLALHCKHGLLRSAAACPLLPSPHDDAAAGKGERGHQGKQQDAQRDARLADRARQRQHACGSAVISVCSWPVGNRSCAVR